MGKSMKVILPIGIILLGILGKMALTSMKKPPEKKEDAVKALLVDVQSVVKQNLNHQVQSQGTVKPKHNSLLVSEVNGRIIELSEVFIAGGFFARDEVLIRIDPADYETAVKSSEANLAKAQAALQEEKARAKVAETEWKSFTSGNAPELYLRKPQLARELANVRSAEADLERAQRDLQRTVIRAPFAGMVKEKSAEFGQFVSRGANLGSLYGTEIAEVRLPLTDNDLAYIQLPYGNNNNTGVKVTLTARVAGVEQQWPATIVRSEGVVDEKSRVIYAVAQLSDPYGLNSDKKPLSYGRFVQATIQGNYAQDVVVLPRHTLNADNQVLVITDNKVQMRRVDILRMDEDFVYVSGGLNEGDVYATSVIPNPMNGLAVRTSDQVDDSDPVNSEVDEAIVKADHSL